MRPAACLLLFLALATTASADDHAPLYGPATVVDGDTIIVEDTRVRLWGIDAPEKHQTCADAKGARYACGVEAWEFLSRLVGNRRVRCEWKATDRYKRFVGQCFLADLDINRHMVEHGRAVAYRSYSKAYVGEEEVARRQRRGMWAGQFTSPGDWRHTGR